MDAERGLAEVKAELATMGASVDAGAVMHHMNGPKPGDLAALIVVERVIDVVREGYARPDYEVAGYCTCVTCDELCLMDARTTQMVLNVKAKTYPICFPCAQANSAAWEKETDGE